MPTPRRLIPVLLAGWLLLGAPAPAARAEEPAAPPAAAAPAADDGSWIRATEDAQGVLVLELASRVFEPASGKGPRLHLVSAVHVGDAAFYAALQERLDALDLVLFEGVRPSGAEPVDAAAGDDERAAATRRRLELLKVLAAQARGAAGAFPENPATLATGWWKGRTNLLDGILLDGWGRTIRYERRAAAGGAPDAALFSSDGADGRPGTAAAPGDDLRVEVLPPAVDAEERGTGLQAKLAAALGVSFQLDAMDSSRPNWRSSDMGVDELQRRMEGAGVDAAEFIAFLEGTSAMGKMAGKILDGMAKNPKAAAWLRMLVVDTVAASEGGSANPGAGGAALGITAENFTALMKVVLEDRNAVVLRDLRGVLEKEPDLGDVGVFYGAGHMAHLGKLVEKELGYRPVAVTWTRAMSADPRDAGFTPEQARAMRKSMRKMLENGK